MDCSHTLSAILGGVVSLDADAVPEKPGFGSSKVGSKVSLQTFCFLEFDSLLSKAEMQLTLR